MKKIVVALLAAGLAFAISACAVDTPPEPEEPTTTTTEATTEETTTTTEPTTADPSWQDGFLLYRLYHPCMWCLRPSVAGIDTVMFDGTPQHVVQILVENEVLQLGSYIVSANFADGRITLDMNASFPEDTFFRGVGQRQYRDELAVFTNAMLSAFEGNHELMLTAQGQIFSCAYRTYDEPFEYVTFRPTHSEENCWLLEEN